MNRPVPDWLALAGLAGLVGFAILSTGTIVAQPGQPAGKPAADDPGSSDPAAAIVPQKFDHKTHAEHAYPKTARKVVTDDSCSGCHGSDPRGALSTPAKSGHQPCLDSGCHVKWFVSVGSETRKRDPLLYRKAVAFCLGCHQSASGEPPSRHARATADAVYKNNDKPNYHVDFNHYEHTRRTGCRSCHVVDDATFVLVKGAPGHTECATCHGKKKDVAPMSQCAECHTEPAPKDYFQNRWKGSETRSCGTPEHLELAAKQKKPVAEVPCFKHDRQEHRFRDRGRSVLECGECHFMIGERSKWGANRYESIRDIESLPIIHNNRDLAHKSCGESRACHKRDVDDSRGTANCRLCHSQKTIDNDLFEP